MSCFTCSSQTNRDCPSSSARASSRSCSASASCSSRNCFKKSSSLFVISLTLFLSAMYSRRCSINAAKSSAEDAPVEGRSDAAVFCLTELLLAARGCSGLFGCSAFFAASTTAWVALLSFRSNCVIRCDSRSIAACPACMAISRSSTLRPLDAPSAGLPSPSSSSSSSTSSLLASSTAFNGAAAAPVIAKESKSLSALWEFEESPSLWADSMGRASSPANECTRLFRTFPCGKRYIAEARLSMLGAFSGFSSAVSAWPRAEVARVSEPAEALCLGLPSPSSLL
mmetsp:Transcript_109696/g.190285  ORF Transcript_109696/g.190285 Transcript_109696/m.190285 type:complete len:283 (+) Transcript_109696:3421-4269(+)